ncbi:hypothetical protein K493DRAFT_296518 [Basidiobolus meristosporus CBS 931.73]|uniref:Chitin-binding type-1 domain-containing protein n=1 Tax=Basidiobolus meristosporus CBS 931.73 TaxID=1314790 RepID=A0A1Y1Z4T7_9FUNG|nr:hypothetical protein K493DRAFT_296518 [Basidiobolus meristosporus CBS 931.73]|eukprot:ORY05312.1 hypothetical protein K493DRAFT_296518 [Basidiobolus meristosporus CBS 931.73]
MRFSIILTLLVTCGISASQAALSVDGRCGNGVECPAGSCCSQWGFCGVGPSFCGNGSGGGSSTGNGNGNGNNGDAGQPNNQQPPSQPGDGGGNNAGNEPQQPAATPVPAATNTPAANPNPQTTPNNSNNNNHANGANWNQANALVSTLVVLALAGYCNS